MRSRIEPKPRTRRPRMVGLPLPALGVLAASTLLSGLWAPAALALDGRAEVRTTHQEGRAGSDAFRSDNIWELVGLDEMLRFTRTSSLRFEYTARREDLRGSAAGSSIDNRMVVLTPAVSFSWQLDGLRLSAQGRGNRIDRDDSGLPTLRDDSLEFSFWSTYRHDRFLLDLSLQDNLSWRRSDGDDRENRERAGRATARYDLSAGDELQYQFSRIDLDAVSLGHRTTFDTHQFQFRGDHGFAGKRGRASVTLLQSLFRQRDTFDAVSSEQYALPDLAAWYIDDTPERLDPLENQPAQVPALIDNDRTTPTIINLGDSASPGRDQGGDYRNILLDFGQPQAMSAATLYVDRRLTFLPQLVQWDLYFCDEAEGRDWGQPVPPGEWTVQWFELETGRQGWEIRFVSGEVTHRRIKLVDRKLGPTMPDLFVTEFEVYAESRTAAPDRTARTDRTMLTGELDFALRQNLRLRYGTALDRRNQGGDSGRLDRASHAVTMDWRLTDWTVSGQVTANRETGTDGLKTNSDSRQVTLSRRAPGRLSTQLTWIVTHDDNYNARYRTEAVNADATWRAAPALAFTQRATRGWRHSDFGTDDSDSWVLSSEIRSAPRPSLHLDVRRTQRWVSREAGSGFTSYSETQADASWQFLPLLAWSGQIVEQRREVRDWTLRNSVSWTPLPGGSMALSFQANDYQDSRSDQLRRGAGAGLDWRPRPRLTLSGSVDKSYERLAGRQSWPLSFQFRGYWTF